jgi:hypothetical protein
MREKLIGIGICVLVLAAAAAVPSSATKKDAPVTISSVKWEQLPDITVNGTDIAMTANTGAPRELADDFLCTQTGPITDVHLWGSWMNDQTGVIAMIHLSIHSNIPADQSPTGYSIPGPVLWQMNFTPGQWTQKIYHEGTAEWWYDPYSGLLLPNADHAVWEVDITIDQVQAFVQQGTATNPITYWLDAYVITQSGTFGWKTTPTHWSDDAVYLLPGANPWQELIYPVGHPHAGQSIDLAFRLTTLTPCCYQVAVKFLSFFNVKVHVKETCNQSHTNVPWNITLTMGANHKYFTGTIASIAPGATVTINTGLVLWLGSATATVTIDDCPPVQKKVFFVLFWVIALPF